jgi:hypothetical protein
MNFPYVEVFITYKLEQNKFEPNQQLEAVIKKTAYNLRGAFGSSRYLPWQAERCISFQFPDLYSAKEFFNSMYNMFEVRRIWNECHLSEGGHVNKLKYS